MAPTANQETLAEQLLNESGDVNSAINALRTAQAKKVNNSTQPHSDEVVVRLEHLHKSYKVGHTKVNALNDVNLTIYKGEFTAITGTSGSGKSTLLQLIGGLDKPNSGIIEVTGQNIAKLRDAKLAQFRNRTIGFVFQFFYLQPFLNLQTNIEVPAIFARTKHHDRTARSTELAKIVGLGDRLKHLPRELSGGQMQRAAIARALENNPSILLADEPTGNLDRTNALAIFNLFKKIRDEQGTTIVVVTHDMELASMTDRSITMNDGAIL